jgi:DNA-binding HxlR family transcriptional regulator
VSFQDRHRVHEDCRKACQVLARVGDQWSVLVLVLLVDGPPRFFDSITGASEYRIARFRGR